MPHLTCLLWFVFQIGVLVALRESHSVYGRSLFAGSSAVSGKTQLLKQP